MTTPTPLNAPPVITPHISPKGLLRELLKLALRLYKDAKVAATKCAAATLAHREAHQASARAEAVRLAAVTAKIDADVAHATASRTTADAVEHSASVADRVSVLREA